MSESTTPITILTRQARPTGTEPRCGSCGAKCHPRTILGEVRCHQCQPRDTWKTIGEPGDMVTPQEFTKNNASARAELIRQRTRDRKQQEAMIAAEMAIQQAVPIVEEVFDTARSDTIIKRFQARGTKVREVTTPPSPLVAAMPVADIPPLADPIAQPVFPPIDDPSLRLVSQRWRARVAAERAAIGPE